MDEIKEIVTRAGFVRVLTRRYEANQAAGTPQSMRAIFDDLEEEFENHYQQPLNWTYSGLKHYRQRYPDSWNQEPKQ